MRSSLLCIIRAVNKLMSELFIINYAHIGSVAADGHANCGDNVKDLETHEIALLADNKIKNCLQRLCCVEPV